MQVPFLNKPAADLERTHFIDTFRDQLRSALASLDKISNPTDADIQQALFSALGNQGGLNVLGDLSNNGLDYHDVVITHPNVGGFQIEMRLHQDVLKDPVTVDFSTGLASLPFHVRLNGQINVGVGVDYELAFRYDPSATQYVSLVTSALLDDFPSSLNGRLPDAHHELALSVQATLPDGFNATADVGFLYGSASDIGNPSSSNPADRTALGVSYVMDGLDNPQSAGVDGRADMNLRLKAGFSPDAVGSDIAIALPDIRTDFHLHWLFDSSHPDLNPPSVSYDNVGVGLGSFLSGFLAPVLTRIQRVTEPFEPIISVMTYPIPGLSDVSHILGDVEPFHGNDVTLLGLADEAASLLVPGSGPIADLISKAIQIVDEINSIQVGDEVVIPLGEFDLNQYDLRSQEPAKDITEVSSTEPLTHLEANNSSFPTLRDAVNELKDLKTGVPVADDVKNKVLDIFDQSSSVKLDYPIVDDPADCVFQLLLGQDAPLVRLTADVPSARARGSVASGLSFFGMGLNVTGDITVNAHLELGYDTFGIRELLGAIVSPGFDPGEIPSDIGDGFYVSDSTQFSLAGRIGIEKGIDFGLLHAAAGGYVRTGNEGHAPVMISIADPTPGDGTLRFGDIFSSSFFHTEGVLDAALGLHVGVGVDFPDPVGFVGIEHVIDIASVRILDLTHDPSQEVPLLADSDGNDTGGVVRLYAGPLALDRRVYDDRGNVIPLQDQDANEAFTVVHAGDDDDAWGGETIDVYAYGNKQTIHHVKTIIADGLVGHFLITGTTVFREPGDLTVNVSPRVHAEADLSGGSKHAYFTYIGSGTAVLNAGQLDSTLVGGSGSNHLTGGDGNDTIIGGSGSNDIHGLGGKNAISVPAPGPAPLIDAGSEPGNIVEITGGLGVESLKVDPALEAVVVTASDSRQQPVFSAIIGGQVAQLMLTRITGLNTITLNDLSGTRLHQIIVNAARNSANQAPITVTAKGSPGNDSYLESVEEPGNGTPAVLHVDLTPPSRYGSGLKLRVVGVHGGDNVLLDGGQGNDTYSVSLDGPFPLTTTIQDSGTSTGNSLYVNGDSFTSTNPIAVSIEPGSIVFTSNTFAGGLSFKENNTVNFMGGFKALTVSGSMLSPTRLRAASASPSQALPSPRQSTAATGRTASL